VIATFGDQATDAGNMALATGIPAFVWVFFWTAISIFMLALGLRLFAARNRRDADNIFEA
jgi:hypothetical protein